MTWDKVLTGLLLAIAVVVLLAIPLARKALERLPPPKPNPDIVAAVEAIEEAEGALARMDYNMTKALNDLKRANEIIDSLEDVVEAKVLGNKWIKAEVTAYTPFAESTGKHPGHPAFNVTASGLAGGMGICAADPVWPFGTVFYIPGLGACVVLDRGGAIRNRGHLHRIDYMVATDWMDRRTAVSIARQWGRRRLAVRVLYVP